MGGRDGVEASRSAEDGVGGGEAGADGRGRGGEGADEEGRGGLTCRVLGLEDYARGRRAFDGEGDSRDPSGGACK